MPFFLCAEFGLNGNIRFVPFKKHALALCKQEQMDEKIKNEG
jgi:hypothetical protein